MSLFRIGSNFGSNDEIGRIKKEISDCDSDISAFNFDETKEESDKTSVQSDVNATQSAMSTAEANVSTAQNAVTSAQNAITSAQNAISSAQSAVSSASSIPGEEIKDEEGNVIGMDFSAREAAVAEAQAQLSAAQAQLSEAEGQLNNAQTQYTQAQAEQQKTKSDYLNMLDELEAIENELNNLQSNIDSTESEKSRLESELQAKEAEQAKQEENKGDKPTTPVPAPPPDEQEIPSPTTPKWSSYQDKSSLNPTEEKDENSVVEAKTAEEAMKNTAIGGVFELPNEDKIFIKTEDDKYEQLDITKETYKKLFKTEKTDISREIDELQDLINKRQKEEFSGLGTNKDATQQLGLTKDLSDLIPSNAISKTSSKLFNNAETKYLFLSCFSEDNDGNISITLPNSDYTFTLNKNDEINKYNKQEHSSNTCLGLEMFDIATSTFLKQASINYQIKNTDKKLEEGMPCSDEMANQIKKIVAYAAQNDIPDFDYIIDEYCYNTKSGEPTDNLKEVTDKKLFEMLENLSKEEIKNSEIDYIYNLAIKENLLLELEDEKENPSTENTPKLEDTIQVLAQFGLDENYKKINQESYELAEEFINTHSKNENTKFNTEVIAAYINNNENNTKILEKLIQQEELEYWPDNITSFFKEANKENSDIDFILESIDLNWNPTVIFSEDYITPENIDFAKKFKELCGEDRTLVEFDYILKANKILPEEELIEHLKTTELNVITEATDNIFSIIPSFEDDGTTRSELLKVDAQKLYEAMLTGKNIEDLIVPTFNSEKQGLKKSEIGDVFEVSGEDNIYIKTGNKESEQLNITKETYNKLFPAVQRYMSEQGQIGDCYLVSMLNNIMTTPEQRHVLLRCFSEDDNGNITVDLPNGNYSFTLENGKEVTDYEDPKLLSNSSTGMQMLEFCYGISLKDEELAKNMEELTKYEEFLLDEDYEKYTLEETFKFNELSQFILTNTELETKEQAVGIISNFDFFDSEEKKLAYLNIALPNIDEEIINQISDFLEVDDTSNNYLALIMEKSLIEDKRDSIMNDPYGTILRDEGGTLKEVYECFGIETQTCDLQSNFNLRGTTLPNGGAYQVTSNSLSTLLANPNIQIVAGGTIGSSDSEMLDFKLNIAGNHAYTIYPREKENGEWLFEVINPWDEARTSILTIDDMEKYFDHIEYIEKEQKKESFLENFFNNF